MFSLRLKELREKMGLSQRDLAEEIGVSQGTIGNWESGTREPNFETVRKLAEYFSVSTDFLLGNQRKKEDAQEKTVSDEDIQFALFGGRVTDEAYEDVKKFAAFIKEKYGEK